MICRAAARVDYFVGCIGGFDLTGLKISLTPLLIMALAAALLAEFETRLPALSTIISSAAPTRLSAIPPAMLPRPFETTRLRASWAAALVASLPATARNCLSSVIALSAAVLRVLPAALRIAAAIPVAVAALPVIAAIGPAMGAAGGKARWRTGDQRCPEPSMQLTGVGYKSIEPCRLL